MATKKPSIPFKSRIQITLLSFITDIVRRHNGTINRRLFTILDRRVPPNLTPHNSVSSHDVVYNPSNNLYFRLFIPHQNNNTVTVTVTSLRPILVYFHGGGFAFLSASSKSYDVFCRHLCHQLNVVVCSVEYRLTPEHKFPSQYDDAFTFLKYLDSNVNVQNTPHWPANADVSCTFLAGDSAGGNIAHHLSVQYATSALSFSNVKVKGLVNIQPFYGGKERVDSEVQLEGMPIITLEKVEWFLRAFLKDGLDFDHWAVNVSGPNAVDIKKLVDFPPVLLMVGGFDPLKDWQKRYYEWLLRNGKDVELIEYENDIHAFYLFPELLAKNNLFFFHLKEFINKCR